VADPQVNLRLSADLGQTALRTAITEATDRSASAGRVFPPCRIGATVNFGAAAEFLAQIIHSRAVKQAASPASG
jgi:hypothetical protein